MKTVLTYGTFDLFHLGHVKILERAKALGDYLIVAVSTDEFNSVKGKKCFYSFEHRQEIVKAIRFVDKVIPENRWEQKVDDIKTNNVDILVMGDDWKGKFDDLSNLCSIVYLPRTKDISTTQIKSQLQNSDGEAS